MEQLKDEKDPRKEQLENELFFYIRSGDTVKLKTVLEDEEKEVTVPVWEIGASGAVGSVDEFGRSFDAKSDNGDLKIKVPAFGAYIIKLD